jgi:hypothetical protein
MSTGHFSPQSSLPPLSQKVINTTTWGSTANTCTITDEYIHPNSVVLAYSTGATPQNGRWSFTITQGQVVIKSTDAENSALPVSYIVL